MECSDVRLARMSKMLEQRAVRTVCARRGAAAARPTLTLTLTLTLP